MFHKLTRKRRISKSNDIALSLHRMLNAAMISSQMGGRIQVLSNWEDDMAESLAQVISMFLFATFYLMGSAHQRQGLPFGKFMVVECPCSKTDMPAFEQRHSTRKNLPNFPLHTRKENLSIGNVYNKELTNCQILVKCPWLV